MAKNELRKMSRKELIEIIYALKKRETELGAALEESLSGGGLGSDSENDSEKDASEILAEKEIVSLNDVVEERSRLNYKKRYRRVLRSTIGALVVVAAIAVLMATLIFPVLRVSGDSMEPTLEDEDIILLVKTSNFDTGDLCSFSWQNKLLIKRIIGVPGDVIDIDKNGVVSVNGEVIDEPYVDDLALGECDMEFPYQVPENRYFVLGDHRSVSVDSRSSSIGCIEKDQMVGKVFLRVWPLKSFSLMS